MASIKQDSNPTSLEIPIHHKINMRNIVMRQTDYSESVADEKLELYKLSVTLSNTCVARHACRNS